MQTSTDGIPRVGEAGGRSLPSGRLLFRFAIGLMQLTAQRFGSVLRAASGARPPTVRDAAVEMRTSRWRDIAIGSLVAIPGAVTELRSLVRARTLRARRLARRYARLRGDLAGIPRSLLRVELWEARATDQLDRLADAGQREQAAARSLAAGVVKRLIEGGAAEFAEGGGVERVIQQETQGRRVLGIPREERT
jgi:hypothetical protein